MNDVWRIGTLQTAKLNGSSGPRVATRQNVKGSASCTRGVGGGGAPLAAVRGTDLRQNWRRSRWQRDILGWRTPAAAGGSGYTGWAGDWPAGRPGPVLITHAGRVGGRGWGGARGPDPRVVKYSRGLL